MEENIQMEDAGMGETQSKRHSSTDSSNRDSGYNMEEKEPEENQNIVDTHKIDCLITDTVFALNHATIDSLKSPSSEAKCELQEAFSLSECQMQQAEQNATLKEPPQVTITIKVTRAEGLKPKKKGSILSSYIPGSSKTKDVVFSESQGDSENELRNTYCTITVEDQKFESPIVNASLKPEFNYQADILKRNLGPYKTTICIWESLTRKQDINHKTDEMRKFDQIDKLLGYINVDITDEQIDDWFELKNDKENECVIKRGKIHVRVTSFVNMKKNISGREGYIILYEKLWVNSHRGKRCPSFSSFSTVDSAYSEEEYEKVSDKILKQYAYVTSLQSYEVAYAQWIVCSKIKDIDYRLMLNHLEEISFFSDIKLNEEEQKVLSDTNEKCYSTFVKKLKDLTDNFQFVVADSESEEKILQLENMLRCMKLLSEKIMGSKSLQEDVRSALIEHAHNSWNKNLINEPVTEYKKSEEQLLLDESDLAEKCGGFLEDVKNFYNPILKREINISHQEIVHRIFSNNVADRVQPILKRLYKGDRGKSRENWNDPLYLEPSRDYTNDTPAYKLFKRIKRIESFSEIKDDSALYSYHMWFSVGLNYWRERITARLIKSVKKEIEKDDFTEALKSSKEIVDLINITLGTWKQIGVVSNDFGIAFYEKLLADLVAVVDSYRKDINNKLKSSVNLENNGSPSLQMCIALNNLEKVYQKTKMLPDDFKVYSNNETPKEPTCVHTMSQKLEETINGFINKNTQQHEKHFILGITECCTSGNDTKILQHIQSVLDHIESNFSDMNCILFIGNFWGVLIRSFKNVLEEKSRIRKPDYFDRGYQLLRNCKEYITSQRDSKIPTERIKTKDYIFVKDKLKRLRSSTLKLISMYFKDQCDYQDNAESVANIKARIEFNDESRNLCIQIPMVDNIKVDVSHLSYYISISLLPHSHFLKTLNDETNVETGTQQVFDYEKQIKIDFDDSIINSGYVELILRQKKYPFKDHAFGCVILPIKHQDKETKSTFNDYKMVKPMDMRENEVLKTLKERKNWDKEATSFLQYLEF